MGKRPLRRVTVALRKRTLGVGRPVLRDSGNRRTDQTTSLNLRPRWYDWYIDREKQFRVRPNRFGRNFNVRMYVDHFRTSRSITPSFSVQLRLVPSLLVVCHGFIVKAFEQGLLFAIKLFDRVYVVHYDIMFTAGRLKFCLYNNFFYKLNCGRSFVHRVGTSDIIFCRFIYFIFSTRCLKFIFMLLSLHLQFVMYTYTILLSLR